jgi:hypothetical protein
MLQGKLPLCAEMCSIKSLLAADGEIIAQIYKERVIKRRLRFGLLGLGDYIKFSFIMMSLLQLVAPPCGTSKRRGEKLLGFASERSPLRLN